MKLSLTTAKQYLSENGFSASRTHICETIGRNPQIAEIMLVGAGRTAYIIDPDELLKVYQSGALHPSGRPPVHECSKSDGKCKGRREQIGDNWLCQKHKKEKK